MGLRRLLLVVSVLAPATGAWAEATSGQPSSVSEVVITGQASQGYRIDDVPILGPLGDRSIQDTPYSISAISSDLIKNIGANTTDAAFRVNPLVQATTPSLRNGQTYLNIRGLSVTNKFVDNLRASPYELIPVEDKDQIDIILGPTGFLYGRSDPGGAVDYVLKRPTARRFAEATIGDYYGSSSVYGQFDAGGPVDSAGRFGFRLNLAGATGDTAVNRQNEDRAVVSAALDWNLTSRLKLQADYSYDYDRLNGSPPEWNASLLAFVPPADKLWSQPWAFSSYETNRGAVRLLGDLSDTFRVRSAISYSVSDDTFLTWNTPQTGSDGLHYTPFVGINPPIEFDNLAGYGYIDARFASFGLKHTLTLGINANRTELFEGPNFRQFCLSPYGAIGFANCSPPTSSPFSIASGPLYLPRPADALFLGPYKSGAYLNSTQRNVAEVLGDDIAVNAWVELLVGVSRVDLASFSYNAAGVVTATYDKVAYTPNASLLIKPLPWLTGYFTYSQGLEQGTIVGPGYSNTGAVLPPNQTEQYEVGVKGQVSGLLLTAALFRLTRPNQYSDLASPLPTFVADGLQRDQGLELSATGKLLPRLSIVGGVTLLDAEVERSNNPAVIGKRPVSVSDVLAKIYLDYELPFTHGLFVSGGVNYTGDFPTDPMNTLFLPRVTTVDLGARLERIIDDHPVVFRIYASNIANKSYWMSAFDEGSPLRVALSFSARF